MRQFRLRQQLQIADLASHSRNFAILVETRPTPEAHRNVPPAKPFATVTVLFEVDLDMLKTKEGFVRIVLKKSVAWLVWR